MKVYTFVRLYVFLSAFAVVKAASMDVSLAADVSGDGPSVLKKGSLAFAADGMVVDTKNPFSSFSPKAGALASTRRFLSALKVLTPKLGGKTPEETRRLRYFCGWDSPTSTSSRKKAEEEKIAMRDKVSFYAHLVYDDYCRIYKFFDRSHDSAELQEKMEYCLLQFFIALRAWRRHSSLAPQGGVLNEQVEKVIEYCIAFAPDPVHAKARVREFVEKMTQAGDEWVTLQSDQIKMNQKLVNNSFELFERRVKESKTLKEIDALSDTIKEWLLMDESAVLLELWSERIIDLYNALNEKRFSFSPSSIKV